MLQFYFLSVALNLLIGIILVFNKEDSVINKIFDTKDSVFHLVVGFLSVFTGLIKLLVPVNGVVFFGDFVPALFGILGGISLLILYFSEKSTEEVEFPAIIKQIFIDNQKYVGIFCLVAAFLHFILPKVLFL